jgi:hypothetical protein
MSKLLATLVLLAVSTAAHAQALPADVAATYQQQADASYTIAMRGCSMMGMFPSRQASCEAAALRDRDTYMLRAASLYWSVVVRDDARKQFNTAAANCRKTNGDTCLDSLQSASEDYYRADVDVRRAQ